MPVKPIPDGFHTLTPHLVVDGAAAAIDYYQKAFGAKELMRMPGPGGKIMHALIQIGDSKVMLNDEFPERKARGPKAIGGSAVTLTLYVPDVDHTVAQAVAAGGKVTMPVADQFWGDRYGTLIDPFGHLWAVATHTADLSPEQIAKAAAAFAG
jgi:PhnB protein